MGSVKYKLPTYPQRKAEEMIPCAGGKNESHSTAERAYTAADCYSLQQERHVRLNLYLLCQ